MTIAADAPAPVPRATPGPAVPADMTPVSAPPTPVAPAGLWRFTPALISAAAALWFAQFLPRMPVGDYAVAVWPLVSHLGVEAAFRIDGLSLTFALMATGIGAVVLLYAAEYFRKDPRLKRLMVLLLIFEAAMLGLVLADDVITLFVFWEATTITSFLLVGFDSHREDARAKALQALLLTGFGGLALLGGLALMAAAGGETRLSMLAGAELRDHAAYPAFLALILLGCFTKSAQTPFHFWLPNAMAAPTPVSAYLHSATMVKAGVYLLARLTPSLGGTEIWVWSLTIAGAATTLMGAIWALRQTDLKLMLAYTTVSGLGSLVMFLGGSDPAAITAAATFIVVHSLYKCSLFLAIGALDKMAGTRDLTLLGGLGRSMPLIWIVAVVSGFSMAGFPPLLGFIGKELKYEGALAVASEPWLVAGAAVIANALMGAVALTIALQPFTGPRKAPKEQPTDPTWPLWLGPLALSGMSLAFGLAPGALSEVLIQPMATAITGAPQEVSLKLWHGVNVPLILSVATFLLALLFYFYKPLMRSGLGVVARATTRFERGYDLALAGLKGAAAFTRSVAEPQEMTKALAVLAFAMVALLGGALAMSLVGGGGLPNLRFGPVTAIELAVAALVAAGALALPFARSRVQALGALGVTGVGVALVFALYGAVDVAITQLLVETLVVVIFAAAMVRLPYLSQRLAPRRRVIAVLLSGGAGLGVTLATLAALERPFDRSLSDWFDAASGPAGLGRNVVNVILVDFRALDTLGEAAVVAIAAIAAMAALGRARERRSRIERREARGLAGDPAVLHEMERRT